MMKIISKILKINVNYKFNYNNNTLNVNYKFIYNTLNVI